MNAESIASMVKEAEAHLRAGRLAESEALCRRVIAQQPGNALSRHYLGIIAFHTGRTSEAFDLLRQAADAEPANAMFWYTLAQVESLAGRHVEALSHAERAVKLAPDDPAHRYMLGSLAGELGQLSLAIENLEAAIRLKPDMAVAHNNLGQTMCLARRLDRALECFATAVARDPNHRMSADNLVYYSHFDAGADGPAIRRAAEAWAARFAEPLTAQAPPHPNDRSPDRPLRIGYVSPDLYEHPVGRFLAVILANHSRAHFQAVCYSGCTAPDAMTVRLKSLASGWRDTAAMSDEALAVQIRQDRIDILVDLSLHMGGNRLLALARRPAPVQITYLGYAGTSGMSAMDWRFSDAHLDPPPAASSVELGNDAFYTEKTMRLARSYWCYAPPPGVGEVRPRPAGPIHFACTNAPFKVSDAALSAWGQILARVPDSRLLLHAQPGPHLKDILEQLGCAPERVDFRAYCHLLPYFHGYHDVDILLDPFPYAGGTTSCDAMWMGVPVVTLAGKIAVHRGGVSLLTNLGMTDLIALTVESYISAAVGLAHSRQRLAELRATLRQRMSESILMNPGEFIADLESSFRAMWRQWARR